MELDAARSQKGAYALGLLRRACAIWRWCLVHRPSWWPEGIVLQEQTPEKKGNINNTFRSINKLPQFNLFPYQSPLTCSTVSVSAVETKWVLVNLSHTPSPRSLM